MNFDANEYNITVRRVTLDGTAMFEARVTELPDIRGYAESAGDAHAKAVEAIEALHEMALQDHEDFPAPAAPEDEFSGRVTLRMPKAVHRAIAEKAAEDGVSINWYIVTILATSLNDYVRAACEIKVLGSAQGAAWTQNVAMWAPNGAPPYGMWGGISSVAGGLSTVVSGISTVGAVGTVGQQAPTVAANGQVIVNVMEQVFMPVSNAESRDDRNPVRRRA
jgi:predicted HicB family RNase H-like nuclease